MLDYLKVKLVYGRKEILPSTTEYVVSLIMERKLLIDLDHHFNNLPEDLRLRFEGLDMLPFVDSKESWRDDELLQKKALALNRLSNTRCIEFGRHVFQVLKNNVSQQIMGLLLLLAYNLKGQTENTYVFSEDILDEWMSPDDVMIKELGKNLLLGEAQTTTIVESSSNDDVLAKAYCFLAAASLRLFSKPPENFESAFDHICHVFSRFYSANFPITNCKPGLVALKVTANYYTNINYPISDVFRNTLYRLLYSSNAIEHRNKPMRNFLFDNYLTNTGLHVITLFSSCVETLHVEPSELLHHLSRQCIPTRTLLSVRKLISDLMRSRREEHRRQMWRYARIFDHKFFTMLQTKNCCRLVAVLAHVMRKLRADTSQGILRITQLQELSNEAKAQAERTADCLIKSITIAKGDNDATLI